jgi:hypothetical protein
MTPRDYLGYAEKPAGTFRNITAPRSGLSQPQSKKAQINPGLSLSLDDKRGSRQTPAAGP